MVLKTGLLIAVRIPTPRSRAGSSAGSSRAPAPSGKRPVRRAGGRAGRPQATGAPGGRPARADPDAARIRAQARPTSRPAAAHRLAERSCRERRSDYPTAAAGSTFGRPGRAARRRPRGTAIAPSRRGRHGVPERRESRLRQPPSSAPSHRLAPGRARRPPAGSSGGSPASAPSERVGSPRASRPRARSAATIGPWKATRPSRAHDLEQERRQVRVADVGARMARRAAPSRCSGSTRSSAVAAAGEEDRAERRVGGELVEGRRGARRRCRRRGRSRRRGCAPSTGSKPSAAQRREARAARRSGSTGPDSAATPTRSPGRTAGGRTGVGDHGSGCKGPESPVSRILSPARRRAAVIPLGPALPPASSNLPGNGAGRRIAGRSGTGGPRPLPYLVLLRMGFAVPRPSPAGRCALTAPFHPYRTRPRTPRRFVFCCTFRRVAAPRR